MKVMSGEEVLAEIQSIGTEKTLVRLVRSVGQQHILIEKQGEEICTLKETIEAQKKLFAKLSKELTELTEGITAINDSLGMMSDCAEC